VIDFIEIGKLLVSGAKNAQNSQVLAPLSAAISGKSKHGGRKNFWKFRGTVEHSPPLFLLLTKETN
jgi:hypothetical protein